MYVIMYIYVHLHIVYRFTSPFFWLLIQKGHTHFHCKEVGKDLILRCNTLNFRQLVVMARSDP